MKEQNFTPDAFTFVVNSGVKSLIDDFALTDDIVYRKESASGGVDGRAAGFGFASFVTASATRRIHDALKETPGLPVARLTNDMVAVLKKTVSSLDEYPVVQNLLSLERIPWLVDAADSALSALMTARYNDNFGPGARFFYAVSGARVECVRDKNDDLVLRPSYTVRVWLNRPGSLFAADRRYEDERTVKGGVLVNMSDESLQAEVASMGRRRPYMWLLDARSPFYVDQAYAAVASGIAADELVDALRSAAARDLGALEADAEAVIDEFGGRLRSLMPAVR